MRSPAPSPQEWSHAAAVIAGAAAADTLDELVRQLLVGCHALFDAELVIWDQFDREARQQAYQMHPPATPAIAALQPAFVRYWPQHPFAADWVRTIGGGRVGILSDRVSTREFLRTDLWREVYIHLRAKHQLSLGGRIAPDRYWSIGCNRLQRDYGPRDRELGRFLQPHITALFQRQFRRERARGATTLLRKLLSPKDVAWVIADAAGCVQEISEFAQRLLGTDHAVTPGSTVLAELAVAAPTGAAFEPVTHRRLFQLPVIVIRSSPVGPALALFTPEPPKAASRTTPITSRENEILHWIGEGKNNREISILLGISPRTVEKHCERLFEKLGVENRLSAALLARR